MLGSGDSCIANADNIVLQRPVIQWGQTGFGGERQLWICNNLKLFLKNHYYSSFVNSDVTFN